MINTKAKGSRFERSVKKKLEELSCFVCKQAASVFPDLIVASPDRRMYFIECKWNKYISKEERQRFDELKKYGNCRIAYPKKCLHDKRKTEIVLCDLNYNNCEVL